MSLARSGGRSVSSFGRTRVSVKSDIFTDDLAERLGSRVSACLFASPRTGDSAWANLFAATVKDYRLFNYILDIVPHVPTIGYVALPNATVIQPATAQAGVRLDIFCDHHAICYCAMIDYAIKPPVTNEDKDSLACIAPLPMPLDEYRRDFEPGLKPGNIAEFDQLFAQAIAAPVMALQGSSVEALRVDQDKRNAQYRALGIFIVQHCHVLLALWDGNEIEAMGGSAEVVAFKRDGIPLAVSRSARMSLDGSEIGPVIEILTPRMKNTNGRAEISVRPWGKDVIRRYRGSALRRGRRAATAFIAHFLSREVKDQRCKLPARERQEFACWENFEVLIDLNRHFNGDAAALLQRPDGPERLAQSVDSLFSDSHSDSLGAPPGGIDVKKHALDAAPLWCRLHGVADALAQERQAQFRTDWILLFLAGFIAFLCFASFTHAELGTGPRIVLLSAYFLSFVAMLVLFLRAVRGRHQERYLDYRALAEALRVAVYWKILGIGSRYVDARVAAGVAAGGGARETSVVDINPVGAIANAYPIQQPSELAWVKMCLRTLERLDKPDGHPSHRIDPAGHAIARRYWVRGQYEFYRRQGRRHNERAESNEAHSSVLLLLSPFAFVPILLYLLIFRPEYHSLPQAIVLFLGILPGIAAVLTGYSERLAFNAQARQYDRMRMLFERACKLLPQDVDEETMPLARMLYHELGVEAMRENAEWVAIYRQRPIRPLH